MTRSSDRNTGAGSAVGSAARYALCVWYLWCVLFLGYVILLPSRAESAGDGATKPSPKERTLQTLPAAVRADEKQRARFEKVWNGEPTPVEAVVWSAALFLPAVERAGASIRVNPLLPALDAVEEPWLRANLCQLTARELVRRQRVDEALGYLMQVDRGQSASPTEFDFLVAATAFQLRKVELARDAIGRIERETDAPKRYRHLASKMKEELQQWEPEGLSGIAHDVRDLRRRLQIGDTNERTRELGRGVVKRLDRLIEKAEKGQQGKSGGQSPPVDPGGPGGNFPDFKGEGKVGNRVLRDGDAWGNLPPKERERVLQSLGRDFPPHYRDTIEEYFRRLASESDGTR